VNDAEPRVERSVVWRSLTYALEPVAYVHALWEAGAAAFGRVDPWSDIDAYVVVDDDRVPDVFRVIEAALEGVSPIEQKYEVTHPPESGLFQAFYRLRDASPFLIVDLAVFTRSARGKYLEPELHGKAVFAFNKAQAVEIPHVDTVRFVAALMERKAHLRARFDMFHIFVEKEVHRGNWVEAMDAYRAIVLDSLLEVLRMKHNPVHYSFRSRYVHYELPLEVVSRFQRLCYVRDQHDFQEKYREGVKWFRQALGEVEEAEVRARLGAT